MPGPGAITTVATGVDGRRRTRLGPNRRSIGGAITFVPNWEGLLQPQINLEMADVARSGYAEMKRLVPREWGDTEGALFSRLDQRDGSVYMGSGHFKAPWSEYGAGAEGAATWGSRGAEDFPDGYRPTYDPTTPHGRRAQPFVRPAALKAVREKFGSV